MGKRREHEFTGNRAAGAVREQKGPRRGLRELSKTKRAFMDIDGITHYAFASVGPIYREKSGLPVLAGIVIKHSSSAKQLLPINMPGKSAAFNIDSDLLEQVT